MSRKNLFLRQKILGFELEELIGIGGNSRVYKATKEDESGIDVCAIKHISIPNEQEYQDILDQMNGDIKLADEYFKSIYEEVVNEIKVFRNLSKKDNKNIITYYDSEIIRNEENKKVDIFIRMEYLTPLNKVLDTENISINDVISLAQDISNALVLCHENHIVHGDIKIDNIFVNEYRRFKLGDFGISKPINNLVVGTKEYMAPEKFVSQQNQDLYSLGMVLYKILNGNRLPFLPVYSNTYSQEDIEYAQRRRLNGEIPDLPIFAQNELGELVLKLISSSGSRHKNVELFISELQSVTKSLGRNELEKNITIYNDDDDYKTLKGDIDINKVRQETRVYEEKRLSNKININEEFKENRNNTNKTVDKVNTQENIKNKKPIAKLIIILAIISIIGFSFILFKKFNSYEKNQDNALEDDTQMIEQDGDTENIKDTETEENSDMDIKEEDYIITENLPSTLAIDDNVEIKLLEINNVGEQTTLKISVTNNNDIEVKFFEVPKLYSKGMTVEPNMFDNMTSATGSVLPGSSNEFIFTYPKEYTKEYFEIHGKLFTMGFESNKDFILKVN